jgi:hypothetical protein
LALDVSIVLHTLFGSGGDGLDDRKAMEAMETMDTMDAMDSTDGREGMMGMDSRESMGNGNTGMDNRLDMGNGLLNSHMVLVNDGGFDDMVNGMDLVRLGDGIGLRDLNGEGLGHVLLNDDLFFNWDEVGDGHGDLNGVYFKLRLDVGNLRGDDGVSPDGSLDFGDGDGVSRGGSLVSGCGRNGSIRCRCCSDGGGCNGHGSFAGFGGPSDISVGGSLAHGLLLGIGHASLDGLSAYLDCTMTNDRLGGVGNGGTRDEMLLHTGAYMHGMGGCMKKSGSHVGMDTVGGGLAQGH